MSSSRARLGGRCIDAIALLLGSLLCYWPKPMRGESQPGPNEFYIVSEVVSDASPFWYHYVLHVKTEGGDSVIRYIRIAPMDAMCADSMTVRAASVRLYGVLASDLAKSYDMCGIDPVVLTSRLQRRTRKTTVIDDSLRFSVVVNCGSKEAVLHFPFPEQVNLQGLRKSDPTLAHWWDLWDAVKRKGFGDAQVFHDPSAGHEELLQREGEMVVPELRSGRFDKGLRPRCIGVQPCTSRSFRDELWGYVGQLGRSGYEPKLIQTDAFSFKRYVTPKYPPLAMQARLSGRVKLELSVDPVSGNVRDIRVVSSHPIFLESVNDAVRQWQFAKPPYRDLEHVPVDLVFEWHCPGIAAK